MATACRPSGVLVAAVEESLCQQSGGFQTCHQAAITHFSLT
jgi:hypothetical protein